MKAINGNVGALIKPLQMCRQEFWKQAQLRFTCSKSTIETLEKGLKYVQS